MYNILSLISLSALAGAAIVQQHPLIQSPHSEVTLIGGPEEFVSSSSLEAHITKEGLLKRAEHLYKLAEQGIPEYNRPTRVIGSQGALPLLGCLLSSLTCAAQDTLQHSTTFTPRSQALGITMRSATRVLMRSSATCSNGDLC